MSMSSAATVDMGGVLEGQIHSSSSHRSPVLVGQEVDLSYPSDTFSLMSRCIQFELDVRSKPLSTFSQLG